MSLEEQNSILIVDDSPTILNILSRMLRDKPYELILATNGQEGIKLSREKKPDLILLDIDMPEMDGFETCRHLKNDEELAEIPVLFISSNITMETKIKSFAVGGLDFISKPVQREELIAHIETHLTLRQLQQKLKRQIEDKKELIRVLGHDISTPITVILGQVELILRKQNKCPQSFPLDRLDIVLKSAQQIKSIINHVREMEMIKLGKNRLKLSPVSLKEVITDSYHLFQSHLKEKQLHLEIIPPLYEMNTKVMAERVSLTTNVLNNLLSNAIKFSIPHSYILLKVQENKDNQTVSIRIKDHGIGIPQDLLKNIFSPTFPTTRKGTANEKGTGFGMPIVKKYLELFDGDIQIQSIVKKDISGFPQHDFGTEVHVILRKA